MKKIITLLSFTISFFTAISQVAPTPVRILFIPLDDRPPCLQFTKEMAVIGNAEVVSPPVELIGKFTVPGQPDKIIAWLNQQDLKSFKMAIISLDMLVYGGLVASRAYNVEVEECLRRMQVISEIRKKAPQLRLYVQSVIMRLAPTSDGKNESYRANLAKWAEVSVVNDDKSKVETNDLITKIPAAALADYKSARQRNLSVNMKAMSLVKSGVIDYLVLSQDDAKPVGVHVADRVKLVDNIGASKLSAKVAVQPGADEVSMLLLARALGQHYKVSPKIRAVYSSTEVSNTVMPFEDKPLKETVSYHIKASGSQEIKGEGDADLLFYVFATRHEAGSAVRFATEIERKVKEGKRVMVADIDPIGNVQGGDSTFTMELAKRGLLPELNSYASWNTAANTIGTSLPQGVVFDIAEARLLANKQLADKIWTAQNWFTFHRVMDDYYFHGSGRLQINRHFGQDKMSSNILSDDTNKQFENYALQLLAPSFEALGKMYAKKIDNSRQKNVSCDQPSGLTFKLPWNRTFEAELDFKMSCKLGR